MSGSRGFSAAARVSSASARRRSPARRGDRAALERRVGIVGRAFQGACEFAVAAHEFASAQRDRAGDQVGLGAERVEVRARLRAASRPSPARAARSAPPARPRARSARARAKASAAATATTAAARAEGDRDAASTRATTPAGGRVSGRRRRVALRARRERAGEPEHRERRRPEPRELPEPVDRAVHGPVAEAGERRGGHAGSRGGHANGRARIAAEQRGAEPDERQQRADEPGLRERPQLDAVRVARRLVAAAVAQVLLLEVVGADAAERMGPEFVERDAVEVVAVAAQAAQQPVAAAESP